MRRCNNDGCQMKKLRLYDDQFKNSKSDYIIFFYFLCIYHYLRVYSCSLSLPTKYEYFRYDT